MAPRDRVTFRFMATPHDANLSGEFVAAGSIMEWIDKAGYACAVGWSSAYCVTAYVGNVHYDRPINPGNVVEASAQIIHTGRTSMHVLVRLASSDVRHEDYQPAMHCLMVFVAVDEHGTPTQVPHWKPRSVEDETLSRNAQQRVAVRQAIHTDMRQATFSDAGTAPRTTLRFLALPGVANFSGKAHGGTVMRWINEAAYVCAVGWSSDRAAVTYTGGIHFYQPIRIGDIVEVEARLIHTTSDSMHMSVHVRSSHPGRADQSVLNTQCVTIFAERAPHDRGGIRELELISQEDRALDQLARRLVAKRATLPRVPDSAPMDVLPSAGVNSDTLT
jgi:4-hydroxybenzoyl-CoA thioesterase